MSDNNKAGGDRSCNECGHAEVFSQRRGGVCEFIVEDNFEDDLKSQMCGCKCVYEATGATDLISRDEAAKFIYAFFVWPDETRGRADLGNDGKPVPKAVFKLFEMINHGIEMEFTALEFVRFRHDVESFGLTLREISRVPYHESETVL